MSEMPQNIPADIPPEMMEQLAAEQGGQELPPEQPQAPPPADPSEALLKAIDTMATAATMAAASSPDGAKALAAAAHSFAQAFVALNPPEVPEAPQNAPEGGQE